ncbi:hypothetical protein DAPPUDRAFT_239494 [Daphnia pulex]|uniref:SET domain-containing protein n=1 Tax=Daphnia pulex TaxID=6669 RepID=E9G9H3_DAPPU|nr:hypothetical protein DAPPUDRAFT_239494 [Daphnia pulex]|eukprot:EFX83877.1 hypothetical protein DAPPUDRAFT_239494 [Daphnia pulex]
MNHVIDAKYQMTVRASVPIMRGDYALALEGLRERQSLLRQSKLFECDCSRCSDPTECSTYLSAQRCQKCPTGFVLPIRPLDEKETEWKGNLCSHKLTAVVVNRVVDKLKEEFETIGPNEVEKYFEILYLIIKVAIKPFLGTGRFEGFLKRHASLVHPNHFLFTSARQSLSQLYGRDEKYLVNTLTMEQLERKVAICRQLLDVPDVVEPGLTRIRGVTLYEMHAPMLLMARRTFEASQISSAEFKEKIESVRSILSEATRILSLEDPASMEGAMGSATVQALDQIQRWISSM